MFIFVVSLLQELVSSLRDNQRAVDDLSDSAQSLSLTTSDTRTANYVKQLGGRYQSLHATAKVSEERLEWQNFTISYRYTII